MGNLNNEDLTQHIVRFWIDTRSKYDQIVTKNSDCLYFCTDTREIFVGDVPYEDSIQEVESLPTENIKKNFLYYIPGETNKGLYYTVDGTTFKQVSIDASVGDFENLYNRPKYNGSTMNKNTSIPEVKTSAWDAKYDKPEDGIPKSDLAAGVQSSIDKADNAKKLEATITVSNPIGSVQSGTILPIGMNMEDIMRMMFTTYVASYTISFDANGGAGTMANQKMPVGQYNNISANTFTRENYTFTGWNTKADGTGTAYTDGQSVKDIASENQTITLYARWSTPVTIYHGATDAIPTDLTGLTSAVVQSSVLVGKYNQHITAGKASTQAAQYVVFAVPTIYVVNKWVVSGVAVDNPHTLVVKDNYNIYYLNSPVYDEDIGGTDYVITVSEV